MLSSLLEGYSTAELVWIGIGLIGQLMFTMRFLVQWIVTERARESIVPLAFWYFSMAGGMTLLTYAIWRKDPVFILGQSTGLLIYSRNLYFIYKNKLASKRTPATAAREAHAEPPALPN